MADDILSQVRLKELVSLCPDTGVFTRIKSGKGFKVGSVAGTLDESNGYWRITIDGKRYYAHHLVWLYHCGELPPAQVDHIDRNRANNRLENLRLATNAENHQNMSLNKNSTSGHAGVSWSKVAKKWWARIMVNYKFIHLGLFLHIDDAIAARKAAEAKYHPFKA